MIKRRGLVLVLATGVISCGGRSSSDPGGEPAGLGAPCQRDFDCLMVSGGTDDSVVRCSASGQCGIAAAVPEWEAACADGAASLPVLERDDSRVVRSEPCNSGICLLRHTSIDPANNMCTSRCAADVDCGVEFSSLTSCMRTEVFADGDTGVIVDVCMPPKPW